MDAWVPSACVVFDVLNFGCGGGSIAMTPSHLQLEASESDTLTTPCFSCVYVCGSCASLGLRYTGCAVVCDCRFGRILLSCLLGRSHSMLRACVSCGPRTAARARSHATRNHGRFTWSLLRCRPSSSCSDNCICARFGSTVKRTQAVAHASQWRLPLLWPTQ